MRDLRADAPAVTCPAGEHAAATVAHRAALHPDVLARQRSAGTRCAALPVVAELKAAAARAVRVLAVPAATCAVRKTVGAGVGGGEDLSAGEGVILRVLAAAAGGEGRAEERERRQGELAGDLDETRHEDVFRDDARRPPRAVVDGVRAAEGRGSARSFSG